MKWNEWFEGFDLEPLQSDLSELCGNLPMSWEWVSLSKWLEMSDLTKPYQNEWNRWEMNELRWNEVKWVNWRIWLCEPYGKIPMVRTRCPYESDLRWVIWSNPIKMIRFNEKWMNWSEMSEMKWNEWMDGNDLEQPYGKGPMSRLRVSLWKWLDVSDLIKPFQNEWNRWEMNELKWIEWNEVKWVIWWKWLCEPYGKVPMVSRRCPYESDLRWVIWSNPIKMIRFNEKWMNWSEMSEMKWNEWFDGNDLEQPYGNGPMVSWECPYQSDWNEPYENVPIKMNGIDEIWMKWSE